MDQHDRNYLNDHRLQSRERWCKDVNDAAMTAVITLPVPSEDAEEDVTVPIRYIICTTCNGRGRHVNPSVDSNGISAEEFAEDPDFAEQYRRGDYDVTCYGCGGKRVQPMLDIDKITKELHARIDKHLEEREAYRRERVNEIARGY